MSAPEAAKAQWLQMGCWIKKIALLLRLRKIDIILVAGRMHARDPGFGRGVALPTMGIFHSPLGSGHDGCCRKADCLQHVMGVTSPRSPRC